MHPGLPLMYYPHWSPALIILYHACFLLDITYSLSLCLLLCVCAPDMFFSTCFSIRIYRYTCVWLCMPLGIHHTTRWGVSDSPGSASPNPGAKSLWILRLLIRDAKWKRGSSADRLRPYPFKPPIQLSSFPLWLVSTFCFVHTCVSLCILAFAPIDDVIFM